MPRHRNLNLQKFILGISEPLLAEYFNRKFANIKSSPLKKLDYESIKEFLENYPDEALRNDIREEFTIINDVCERVMNYLVKAIDYYDIETSGEENSEELAMRIFLYYPEAFNYAYDYYCLYVSTSKMSNHNIDAKSFKITPRKIETLKDKISDYYYNQEKGAECIVRHYDENNQTVIVVMHGSYKRSVSAWQNQEVKPFIYRPAREDVLLYDKTKSILSIKAISKKDKGNYTKLFTETILEDKEQLDRPDIDDTFSLKPLQNGDFSFAGNELIDSIFLLEIKMNMRGATVPTIEVKSSDVIRTFQEEISGINLNSGQLTHAKFRFTLRINGKLTRVTFEITPPNVTNLIRKRHSSIISDYLRENGIQKK